MDHNKVFPGYQRKAPDGHNYLLSATECDPSEPVVLKRRKWPLAVLLLVLLLAAACMLPRVTRFEAIMQGAEVSPDGIVLGSGSFVLEGRIYDYLLREDTLKVDALQIPNRMIGHIIDQAFPVWQTGTSLLQTRVWLELPEYTSDNNWYTGDLFFPENQSWYVLKLTDRIFIGTSQPDCDYAAILESLCAYPASA